MIPILILVIGIILIILNVKAIRKEEKSFNHILEREADNSNKDYGLEIIAIRKDLAETVLDLQKEIEEIKISIEKLKDGSKKDDNKVEDINLKETEDVISEINFSNSLDKENKENKVNQVKTLIEQGLSDDEICEKLSIGRGEVLLIKGLF